MNSANLKSARSVTGRIYLLLVLAVIGVVIGYLIAPPALVDRNREERRFMQRHEQMEHALAELDRLALVEHLDVIRGHHKTLGQPQDLIEDLALNSHYEIEEQLAAVAALEKDDDDPGGRMLLKRLDAEVKTLLSDPASAEAIGRVLLVSEQLQQLGERAKELRDETNSQNRLLENKYLKQGILSVLLMGIMLAGFFIIRSSKRSVQILAETITQRDEQAQALKQERDFVASLTDTAPVIVLLLDPEGLIQHVNPFFEKLTGWQRDEISGKDWFTTFLSERDRESVRALFFGAVQDHPTRGNVSVVLTRDGSERLVEWNDQVIRNREGRVTSLLAIGVDVTERKQLETQVLRKQRLESIGTLAGGLAHDLNNALGPIPIVMELLRQDFPGKGERYLEVINNGANRGIEIVKQLLTFARGTSGERVPIRPRQLLEEMEKLIRSTFPKNIALKIHAAPEPRPVLGDSTQLHQVLLNLCVNARDAMPDGGELVLTARDVEIDKTMAAMISEAVPGRYVLFQVKDTGVGIAPEVLERMFEPFFSTKGLGKGTGLGLSTVMGIVKSHGGFLRAFSTPGAGSTFECYFPIDEVRRAGNSLSQSEAAPVFRAKGETILVVDDEPAICDVARAALKAMHFKVLTANSGADGLVLAAENQTQLRAVITDLHMSGMNGVAFVRELKKTLPQVGVIVITGRMGESEEKELEQLGMNARLNKPFTLEALIAALKTVFKN